MKHFKKVGCQFCHVEFGHQIMEALGLFEYKMRDFTQIVFNFTNRWSNGVVSWFADVILQKWYFPQIYTIK